MNLLSNETSPYLRQHQDNPVHWMPWGDDAFAKARAENKPILLSIGYAACHWCHVMAHESFENHDTASTMNDLFVNIKVDREERPDVDNLYQSALGLMGGQGGWPLTMFLTPDAKPFWGGTYFPPHPRHGLPGFQEVLQGVSDSFLTEHDKINHNVNAMMDALQQLHKAQTGPLFMPEHIPQAGSLLMRLFDPIHGGFAGGAAGAPKFPNLPALNLLWECYVRSGDVTYLDATVLSLTRMCQGGIFDHIGGGFARYTVDAEWVIPHFEKMLYDNAQFISILSEVYRETKHPLFAKRVADTIDWLLREMTIEHDGTTGFASSFDADSLDTHGQSVEGAYYVWTANDVDAALGADAVYFREAFDITSFGNWPEMPGFNVANRLANPSWRGTEDETKLDALCRKLRFHRQQRALPARDGKVLADWNGLAISALAKAGFVFEEQGWITAAENAFAFIIKNMMQADNKLNHVWCLGQTGHASTLDDYAQLSQAALYLYEITTKPAYLNQAQRWATIVLQDYADTAQGGFYMSPNSAKDLPVRPQQTDDSALPAGNAVMVDVLNKLYALTGNDSWRDHAAKTAIAFSAQSAPQFFSRATLLRYSLDLSAPLSVVLAGTPDQQADFITALREISVPHLVVQQAGNTQDIPTTHPAYGKKAPRDSAMAWICPGQSCLTPVTDADTFREMLRATRIGQHRPAANDG